MQMHCHCRQRAPVENVPSASGTSHLGMIDIQATTKSRDEYWKLVAIWLFLLSNDILEFYNIM